jgi:hypothetical protein
MRSLQDRLAEYGFDSRQNHDYSVERFLTAPTDNIRCLNVDGDNQGGRRKTAFAHALAQALGVDHVLYFEFGVEESSRPQVVRVQQGEDVPQEPPTQPFDRVMTESCALSEADKTVLIIDQMHKAPFREHIRLFEFIKSKLWTYSDVRFFANPVNLHIFMISGEPLYSALQQHCFRIWIAAGTEQTVYPTHLELGLPEESSGWLSALNRLLEHLGGCPSMSEYQRLIHDVERHVRTADELKASIYGWLGNVDRARLYGRATIPLVDEVMQALASGMEIQEEIHLGSGPE